MNPESDEHDVNIGTLVHLILATADSVIDVCNTVLASGEGDASYERRRDEIQQLMMDIVALKELYDKPSEAKVHYHGSQRHLEEDVRHLSGGRVSATLLLRPNERDTVTQALSKAAAALPTTNVGTALTHICVAYLNGGAVVGPLGLDELIATAGVYAVLQRLAELHPNLDIHVFGPYPIEPSLPLKVLKGFH